MTCASAAQVENAASNSAVAASDKRIGMLAPFGTVGFEQ
jgi:hypothetical protein